jgi:translation initiation factor 3 subunit G
MNRDQYTIRVTNISEETTEMELQQLFQTFGRISRVYLAKDKETMQSRGFAFVSFIHQEDAAMAMEKLQGYGLNHLILKLEWAKPSSTKDPGSEGTVYRSGYGKALAQDTKEKVSFASNLTK